MINIEDANSFYEVIKILEYVKEEDYSKIPVNLIKTFRTYANYEYDFKYDVNKTLDEQEVSKRAKAIIAILFRNYWATPIQKEKILNKQKYDMQRLEEEKREKISPDNIFKNRNNDKQESINNLPVEVKQENLYHKIVNFIKKYFSKKS